MPRSEPPIGRDAELAELARAVADAAAGRGGLVLLAGEAGVGKTRLAEAALAGSGLVTLRGEASEESTPPYGPLSAALRSYLRADPGGLSDCGQLAGYLGLLLPELGPPPGPGDRPTIAEAVRCALESVGRRSTTAVFLDDLQWADEATLELLLPLAVSLETEPVLLLAAYRNDEIPRGSPLRRLRRDLRRGGRLRELVVEPLDREATAALAEQLLGSRPGPSLVAAVYDRTEGVPFFVEELLATLAVASRLREGRGGVVLLAGGELPMPDTVRDAVLLRVRDLSPPSRAALEAAAVAGGRFELDLVGEVTRGEGLEEAVERGLLVELAPGVACFRHALAREAALRRRPMAAPAGPAPSRGRAARGARRAVGPGRGTLAGRAGAGARAALARLGVRARLRGPRAP